ncbi:MAG: HNH endonuclease [Bacteroides sp.]|uniref:HNH endonuclease n=2 Tax=Bacteroides sp. TaxID=29523 RepID=UPI002FC839D4
MYAIITENDSSEWKDKTGELYHHPKRHLKYLTPGTKVIYYKGRLNDKKYKKFRLTPEAHYFGIGEIGKQYLDPNSTKNDYFSEIINFQSFDKPIFIKDNDGRYLESIPESRKANYWRDGTRPLSQEVYDKILCLSETVVNNVFDDEFTSRSTEGKKIGTYTTRYERDPKLRQQALSFHGYTCMVCGFNFLKAYGDIGRGFIHVHHVNPLFETGEQIVNPKTDLVPVCPNCHCMIHRDKNNTLTVEQLKCMLK